MEFLICEYEKGADSAQCDLNVAEKVRMLVCGQGS
jgi:hypothetical protein